MSQEATPPIEDNSVQDTGQPQREYDRQRDVVEPLQSGSKANDALTGTNDSVWSMVPGRITRKPKK